MNVYEKLVSARLKLQSSGIKQNGKNAYAGYTYFELSDILPICNKICEDVKAVCVVSFNDTIATLDFIDCEKPEDKITFTTPMSEASLKGCHSVQNLGAVETYLKRYLYQNCFEIAECDALDATMNPNVSSPKTPKWSKEQLDELVNVLNSKMTDGSDVFDEQTKNVYRQAYSKNENFETTIEKAKKYLSDRLQSSMKGNIPQDTF